VIVTLIVPLWPGLSTSGVALPLAHRSPVDDETFGSNAFDDRGAAGVGSSIGRVAKPPGATMAGVQEYSDDVRSLSASVATAVVPVVESTPERRRLGWCRSRRRGLSRHLTADPTWP
jgi:hypothetical protein